MQAVDIESLEFLFERFELMDMRYLVADARNGRESCLHYVPLDRMERASMTLTRVLEGVSDDQASDLDGAVVETFRLFKPIFDQNERETQRGTGGVPNPLRTALIDLIGSIIFSCAQMDRNPKSREVLTALAQAYAPTNRLRNAIIRMADVCVVDDRIDTFTVLFAAWLWEHASTLVLKQRQPALQKLEYELVGRRPDLVGEIRSALKSGLAYETPADTTSQAVTDYQFRRRIVEGNPTVWRGIRLEAHAVAGSPPKLAVSVRTRPEAASVTAEWGPGPWIPTAPPREKLGLMRGTAEIPVEPGKTYTIVCEATWGTGARARHEPVTVTVPAIVVPNKRVEIFPDLQEYSGGQAHVMVDVSATGATRIEAWYGDGFVPDTQNGTAYNIVGVRGSFRTAPGKVLWLRARAHWADGTETLSEPVRFAVPGLPLREVAFGWLKGNAWYLLIAILAAPAAYWIIQTIREELSPIAPTSVHVPLEAE